MLTIFSVATNEFRGGNGERTEYHACVLGSSVRDQRPVLIASARNKPEVVGVSACDMTRLVTCWAIAVALVLVGCAASVDVGSGAPPATATRVQWTPTPLATSSIGAPTPATTGSPRPTFPPDFPPVVTINGVAGSLGSFCGPLGCADSGMPGELPVVTEPLALAIPPGSHLVQAVSRSPGATGQGEPLDFEGGQLIGVPDDAVSISVSFRWPAGGDANYYWAVAAGD